MNQMMIRLAPQLRLQLILLLRMVLYAVDTDVFLVVLDVPVVAAVNVTVVGIIIFMIVH